MLKVNIKNIENFGDIKYKTIVQIMPIMLKISKMPV